tara:strand:- start:959 stop:1285 length:327 start_codon:yes stop_codon:yes gene_type:complete
MSKGNGKDKFDFSKGITIVISPHSNSSFACGIDKSYEDNTAERHAVKTIAMGLCDLALNHADMVYEVGLKVRAMRDAQMYDVDISDLEQENVESLEEWIKKLRKPTLN